MIVRPSRRAFVCLHCQIHHIRSLPNYTRFDSYLALRSFSSYRPLPVQDNGDAITQQRVPANRHDGRLSSKPRHYAFKRLSANGTILRGKRGKEFSESSAPLKAKALGKPSEVIILRDVESRRNNSDGDEAGQELVKSGEGEHTQLIDEILASLEDEPVDQDKLEETLDTILPKPISQDQRRARISQQEYDEIEKTLRGSFTRRQLAVYIGHRWKPTDLIELEQLRLWTPWRSIGQPKTFWHRALRHEVFENLGRLTMHSLVALVLHFTVEVAEEVEKYGYMECIRVSKKLALLTAGRPSQLDRIAKARKVRIEVNVDRHVIGITANKADAMRAALDIEEISAAFRTIIVPIPPLSTEYDVEQLADQNGSLLDSIRTEDLKSIARMTSTIIKEKRKQSEIMISGTQLEQIDDARRAIFALVENPDRSIKSLVNLEHTKLDSTSPLHQAPVATVLPMRLRRFDCWRWSRPIQRASTSPETMTRTSLLRDIIVNEDHESSQELSNALQNVIFTSSSSEGTQFVETPKSKSRKTRSRMRWSTDVEVDFAASIGHILHCEKQSAHQAGRNHKSRKIPPGMTMFLNHVPNLAQILPHLSLRPKIATKEIISFRLSPRRARLGPANHALFQALPDVRVDFSVVDRSATGVDVEFVGLYAQPKDRAVDVSLPSLATDIRFKQTTTYKPIPESIESDKFIQHFIQHIRDNIHGGGQLRAPPNVYVMLDAHLLSLREKDNKVLTTKEKQQQLQQKKKQKRKKQQQAAVPPPQPPPPPPQTSEAIDREDLNVEYTFIGVEHRQVVPLALGNCSLTYSRVEAGKIMGRWEELSLHLPLPLPLRSGRAVESSGNGGEKCADSVAAEFARVALRLAGLVDLAAKNRLLPEAAVVAEDLESLFGLEGGAAADADGALASEGDEPIAESENRPDEDNMAQNLAPAERSERVAEDEEQLLPSPSSSSPSSVASGSG